MSNAAVVITIGANGDVISVNAVNSKAGNMSQISTQEAEEHIRSAKKSSSNSIMIHHIEINPCYILITIGRTVYKFPVPC